MIKLNPINKEKAKKEMSNLDDYLRFMTLFNIQRITDVCISKKEFPKYLESTCLDWSKNNIERIIEIENCINNQLKKLNFNFELEVNMIQTNGEDSFNLPYTRFNNIYIPVNEESKNLLGHLNVHLIVHELFHIISRKYPQIRDVLYRIMGFEEIPVFDMEKFLPKYVINPDAVTYRHAKKIMYLNEQYKAIPVIYFNNKNKMKWEDLLLLNSENIPFRMVNRRQTTFIDMEYNTDYLSHPEEICAEHFRKWILEDSDIKNQKLMDDFIDAMKGLFN